MKTVFCFQLLKLSTNFLLGSFLINLLQPDNISNSLKHQIRKIELLLLLILNYCVWEKYFQKCTKMHKEIFFIASYPPSVVHGLTLEKFSNQTPIEVSSTVNMTTSSTNIRWGSKKKKTLSCGKVYGKKCMKNGKKQTFF